MKMPLHQKRPSEAGTSLVEVVVAVTIFAGLFLALIAASNQSLRMANRSKVDLHVWAATQRVADSLSAVDPGGVSIGTRTVDGVQFAWKAPDSVEVTLVVAYTAPVTGENIVDTLTLFRN